MRSWCPYIRSQYVILSFLVILTSTLAVQPNAIAQTKSTVTLTDSTVISNTARAGINLDEPSPAFPDLKNYYAYSNPGFEPILMQQVFQFQGVNANSSPTGFQWDVPNTQYEGYDQNQWAGATFTVVQGSYASTTSDPALGCTGTIASSANQSGAGPIFKINPATNQGSNGCAGSIGLAGQVIIVSTNNKMANVFPTPTSIWTAAGGLNGSPFGFSLSGGATVASETNDLCSTCGQQSLLFTVPNGGSVTLGGGPALNVPSEKSVVLNGTYTVSFWAKSNAAVPPKVALTLTPRAGTACTQTFNGTSSQAITSTWKQFSFNCSFAETPASGGPYPFFTQIAVTPVSGATSLEFDNISMVDMGDTNPTPFTDAYVNALKAWCQTTNNATGPACTLRYSAHPDSETMSNWFKPAFQHQPSIESMTSIATAYSTIKTNPSDFLQLCAYLGATPVLIFPSTSTPAEVQQLVDFLEGPSTTTFGAIRASLGQVAPWVGSSDSPFQTIYLEFGNENWNGGFLGHIWGFNLSAPGFNGFYDYSVRANVIFTAARNYQTSQGYSQAATKWVFNLQTADKGGDLLYNTNKGILTIVHPDAIEFNGYTAYNINDTSTTGCTGSGATNATCPLYGPTLTEPWSNTHDPKSMSGFAQTLQKLATTSLCGPSGKAPCEPMVYEENTGTFNANTAGPFNQAASDSFIQTAFQGVVTADQLGENDAAGVSNQNYFSTLQYYFNEGGVHVHMWGTMLDTGGDCSLNNSSQFGGSFCPRPQMLGAMVYNWCKIGPMVQTSWASGPTYNLPANNNSVNAISGVPVLRSFAFAQGTQRCMVIVNSDVASSYQVSFAGTNAPTKNVTTYQFAPSALNTANEMTALVNTSTLQTPMSNTTTPGVDVTSGYTVPAHSVTAFLWQSSGAAPTPTVATPAFSPAAGTYTSAQSVSISTSTAGDTIYYTTNGSTPSTSSAVYSGPITVSASETLKAIAVESGYSNSSVASAAYVISAAALAAPKFSVAGGTYSSAQTVSISAASGATIYYTTNGTTPTTSSTKYSGAIKVSSSQTLEAIAVETGYTNSPVATATYTISSTLPAPTFSVAAGTYTSAQTVSISDATAGTTIYYTTNGTTPTTSSAKYAGAITVSSTETLEALAVKSGYTNSPVATAAYTIKSTLPAPSFSVAAGTYASPVTVSISDATSGTTIYYTTDGSTPSTSSARYSGALTISATETLSAIAVETGYTNSPVTVAAYTISGGCYLCYVSTPTFSVPAGTYASAQTVSISDSTAGSTIYYTTNGTAPTTSSAVYSSPIVVSATETLEAIAVKSGYTNSSLASASYVISGSSATTPNVVINISNFANATSQLKMNGNAKLDGAKLQLTNGGLYEDSSTWYTQPVNVKSFTTDITFQETNATADGFMFTIQNAGTTALGAGGAGLGFNNIQSSVGLKFYLHAIGSIPQSTGLYTNGAMTWLSTGSLNLVSSGINLRSGDVMILHLAYDGTTLSMTLTDTVTKSVFTHSFAVNIPSTVGGSTAYVGFTGASGGAGANQEILSWVYSN